MEKHKNGFHSKAILFTNSICCLIRISLKTVVRANRKITRKITPSENENGSNGRKSIEKLHSCGRYMGAIFLFNVHNSNMKHIASIPISILVFFSFYLFSLQRVFYLVKISSGKPDVHVSSFFKLKCNNNLQYGAIFLFNVHAIFQPFVILVSTLSFLFQRKEKKTYRHFQSKFMMVIFHFFFLFKNQILYK